MSGNEAITPPPGHQNWPYLYKVQNIYNGNVVSLSLHEEVYNHKCLVFNYHFLVTLVTRLSLG